MGIRTETESALKQEGSVQIGKSTLATTIALGQDSLQDRSNRVRAICFEIAQMRKDFGGGSKTLDPEVEASLLHLSKLDPKTQGQEITRLSSQAIAQAIAATSAEGIAAASLTGIVPVDLGGTGIDASGTGGNGADPHVVTQESVGGPFQVGPFNTQDLVGVAGTTGGGTLLVKQQSPVIVTQIQSGPLRLIAIPQEVRENTSGRVLYEITRQSGSTVNHVAFRSADTLNAPGLDAKGTDTDVGMNFRTKGTGTLQYNGDEILTVAANRGYFPRGW